MKNTGYDLRFFISSILNKNYFLPKKILLKVAVINLTEKCNSKCITCAFWKSNYTDNISTEKAVELIFEIKKLNINIIRFTGGEPLLRKDFFKILNKVRHEKFKRIVLATNGLLIGKYRNEINNSIITNLSVSLDGIGEKNDIIRGVKSGFQIVVENLQGITKKIKIVCNLTSSLAYDIKELLDYCNENGYDFDINILDKNPYFFSDNDVKKALEQLMPSIEEVSNIFSILKEKSKLYNKTLQKNIIEYIKSNKFAFNHCILGYFSVYVSSNGDVRPGCYVFKPVGNIHDTTLNEIIDSEGYERCAFKMYNLECPMCTCGFGISAMYSNPFSNLNYIIKRLGKLRDH